MEREHSSQIQGESQIAQTIGLDDLPPASQTQTQSLTIAEQPCPWGRLFPLNFLFGDNPHSLFDDVVAVGRAEDCTIGNEGFDECNVQFGLQCVGKEKLLGLPRTRWKMPFHLVEDETAWPWLMDQ